MQQDDSDVAKWSHSDDVVDQKQIAVWGDNEPSSHSKTMCAVSHKDYGLELKFCAHKLPFLCKYRACLEGKFRASDFFQDWWAEVTHGAKNGW